MFDLRAYVHGTNVVLLGPGISCRSRRPTRPPKPSADAAAPRKSARRSSAPRWYRVRHLYVELYSKPSSYFLNSEMTDFAIHPGMISERVPGICGTEQVLTQMFLWNFARSKMGPARLKKVFFGMAKMVLGKEAWEVNKAHLMPTYNPWEQRLCVGKRASVTFTPAINEAGRW